MEMHEIRYFLALCETLNFRRAATECNVSQPSLTRAIQKLEDELGGPLFRREGRLTHLTELGVLVRPELKEILCRAQSVKTTARDILTLEQGSLRLGVLCTIGPALFTRFLKDYKAKFPGITITLRDGPPQRLTELLLAEEIDVAVMAQPDPLGDRFRPHPIYSERFVVAFGADHPFVAKDLITPRDMDQQTYLRRLNCEYRQFFANLLREHGVSIRVSYQTEREDWIQSLVAGAMGVCFLPEYSAMVAGLRTLPFVEPEVARTVSVVTVSGRRHLPAVAKFIQHSIQYPWPHI